jgi:hypothetical protein
VAKLILLSIVIVSMAVPIHLCARPSPKRALRRAQWILTAFVFLWAFLCIVWYPKLTPLE